MERNSTLAVSPLWAGACGFSILSLLILLYLAFSSDPSMRIKAIQHGQLHQIDLSTGNITGFDATKSALEEAPDSAQKVSQEKRSSTPYSEESANDPKKETHSALPESEENVEQHGDDKAVVQKKEHAPSASLIDEVMQETKAAMKPKMNAPQNKEFVQKNLLEKTDEGALPKTDGKMRAAEAYAKDASIPAGASPIAVIVTGIGPRSAILEQALALPGAVGIGIAAYSDAPNVKAQTLYAAGHELWLELPMQREDYPASDPGPRGILLKGNQEERLARLRMSLAAMQGYVGLYGEAKEVVSSQAEVIQPLLVEALTRGVYMMFGNRDSGIAKQREVLADSDVMLVHQHIGRNILMTRDLEKRFTLAEQRAKEKAGYLLMIEASALTLRALERWLPALESRGFALVPPSKIYRLNNEG